MRPVLLVVNFQNVLDGDSNGQHGFEDPLVIDFEFDRKDL
jgi:hypothetical protein